ncbi:hypothetical protein NDI56_00670 [Haloarcula sp. S1CR25-12]|uniref:Uncharacterized protein n=1 Tax=Haloarcula saliterrae TaxID=2950534 RepID=A0ABU2F837_9EURY|nr:hypothetical protein [Haloarcula sp. S1CR25-12]MDS0257915.1 hypothetical protein [Haloarcula sp. S1CR25-12]
MELTPDELAGVVDTVGPVTREELVRACGELAFKRGKEGEAFEAAVESALASYHLVEVADHGAEPDAALVVVGPTAFPALPDGAEDLPHILDVPGRTVAREAMARAAEARFREDAAAAVRDGDDERIETLLDVSYDLEAWGPVDLATARGHLDEATHAN